MLNGVIKADLFRYGGLVGFRGFLKGWQISSFRYTYFLRKSAQNKNSLFGNIFYKLVKRRYRIKYGYEISSDAQIGEGFYLSGHCGHVVIGPVKIGRNCNVSHSVTIGRAYKNGIAGRPTIDDYVWIGTGAVLVGEIKIGRNVLIAPNSFVNFDVPDNSLVIGNPGNIIRKEDPTREYINYVMNK